MRKADMAIYTKGTMDALEKGEFVLAEGLECTQETPSGRWKVAGIRIYHKVHLPNRINAL